MATRLSDVLRRGLELRCSLRREGRADDALLIDTLVWAAEAASSGFTQARIVRCGV